MTNFDFLNRCVAFHYNHHEDEKYVQGTIPALDFIKRLTRHIPGGLSYKKTAAKMFNPNGFLIHYFISLQALFLSHRSLVHSCQLFVSHENLPAQMQE